MSRNCSISSGFEVTFTSFRYVENSSQMNCLKAKLSSVLLDHLFVAFNRLHLSNQWWFPIARWTSFKATKYQSLQANSMFSASSFERNLFTQFKRWQRVSFAQQNSTEFGSWIQWTEFPSEFHKSNFLNGALISLESVQVVPLSVRLKYSKQCCGET